MPVVYRDLSKFQASYSGSGFMAECCKTAYVESSTTLYVKEKRRKSSVGFVVDVPPAGQYIRLRVGDLLMIFYDGSDEQNMPPFSTVVAHRITCLYGYLFYSVKPGEPIAFGDGKMWEVVKETGNSEVIVRITHARPKGTKLRLEKSINIPKSDIRYGLISKHLLDLDFIAAPADMVGISFVREVCDISILYQEIASIEVSKLGFVLKI